MPLVAFAGWCTDAQCHMAALVLSVLMKTMPTQSNPDRPLRQTGSCQGAPPDRTTLP